MSHFETLPTKVIRIGNDGGHESFVREAGLVGLFACFSPGSWRSSENVVRWQANCIPPQQSNVALLIFLIPKRNESRAAKSFYRTSRTA